MYGINLLINVLIALISGLAGVFVTMWFQLKLEDRRAKRKVVEDLFAYKYQAIDGIHTQHSQEFIEALNRIPVIFNNSRDALEKYSEYYKVTVSNDNQAKDDALLNLFKCLCKAAELPCDNWDDDMFMKTFRFQ